MPVIDIAPASTPTIQQNLAAAVATQQQQMQGLWQTIQDTMTAIATFIYANPWRDSSGNPVVTPQMVFNAYGANAVDLCKLSDSVIGMIQAYTGSAPQIPPPGIMLTKNADGTVTVGIAS